MSLLAIPEWTPKSDILHFYIFTLLHFTFYSFFAAKPRLATATGRSRQRPRPCSFENDQGLGQEEPI